MLPMQGAHVRSLVMELRSHLLHGAAKQQQKKNYLKKKQDSGYFRHRAGGVQDVAHGWGC